MVEAVRALQFALQEDLKEISYERDKMKQRILTMIIVPLSLHRSNTSQVFSKTFHNNTLQWLFYCHRYFVIRLYQKADWLSLQAGDMDGD